MATAINKTAGVSHNAKATSSGQSIGHLHVSKPQLLRLLSCGVAPNLQAQQVRRFAKHPRAELRVQLRLPRRDCRPVFRVSTVKHLLVPDLALFQSQS